MVSLLEANLYWKEVPNKNNRSFKQVTGVVRCGFKNFVNKTQEEQDFVP